jgi:hypothetical protein
MFYQVGHIPGLHRHENNPFPLVAAKGKFAEVLLPFAGLDFAGFDVRSEVSGDDGLIHDISFQLRVISLLRMNRVCAPQMRNHYDMAHGK